MHLCPLFGRFPARLARWRLVLACAAATAAVGGVSAGSGAGALAGQTYVACLQAMQQDRCVVMVPPLAGVSALSSPAPRADVFVAGVGVVPGRIYQALVASGTQMCERVRQACSAAPQGALCVTAGKLWSVGGRS